jgi:outer membrane immunogenic protein
MTLKLLGAAAFAALFSTSAMAADIITNYEPAPMAPMATAYNWSGVYLGVQGGYVWTDLDFPGGFGSEDFNGATLGGQIGANWQHNNFVFGVEADVAYTWNDNNYTFGGDSVEIGTDWQGSARARLGYAFDRTLVYGTGGLAMTRGFVKAPGFKAEETLTGWTVGGGVEHAFTDNWIARAEYRYSDYGSDDFGLGAGDFDLSEHTVRAGLSYKF